MHYADRAQQVLIGAIAKGFGDVTELNASDAFAPVRQRVDFQELLAGLQAKQKRL